MTDKSLTQERLKELLHYDPDTGIFTRKVSCNRAKKGDHPSCDMGRGYLVVGINYKIYRLHRLAWLYMTGKWPEDQIDHINHQRDDNRWCNLREADHKINSRNMSLAKNNSSGRTGLYWDSLLKKWRVTIYHNKAIYLGVFAEFSDAAKARKAAEEKYGYHENHGLAGDYNV